MKLRASGGLWESPELREEAEWCDSSVGSVRRLICGTEGLGEG